LRLPAMNYGNLKVVTTAAVTAPAAATTTTTTLTTTATTTKQSLSQAAKILKEKCTYLTNDDHLTQALRQINAVNNTTATATPSATHHQQQQLSHIAAAWAYENLQNI